MVINVANHNAPLLPMKFVTERISFLARTGAGKSGGCESSRRKLACAGQFVVFLDPSGDA